jgi:hypothetical protein
VDNVVFPANNCVNTVQELIDFAYPRQLFDDVFANINEIAKGLILAPTNAAVMEINALVLAKITGTDADTYYSIDECTDPDPLHAIRTDAAARDVESLHTFMPSGFPPHELELRVGMICMVIRNLDNALVNGTRVLVLRLLKENIKVRILTGADNWVGQETLITKCRFEWRTRRQSRMRLSFSRIQFPLRPAFACTIHKSQGQTCVRLGLALHCGNPFGHGSSYVPLSRVRHSSTIRVLPYDETRVWPNCVYTHVLERYNGEKVGVDPIPAEPQCDNADANRRMRDLNDPKHQAEHMEW